MSDDGFLSRWARRKADARTGRPLAEPPPARPDAPAPQAPAAPTPEAAGAVAARPAAGFPAGPGAVAPAPAVVNAEPVAPARPDAAPAEPPPTLEEAAGLAPGADVSRFVRRGVDAAVQRTALKRLFADPHFNIMDGLDTYIDDYGRPDPIPAAMLRQMNQSKFLGLFDEEESTQTAHATPDPDAAPAAAQDAGPADPAAVPHASHEDADLQLQPDDAAGRPGAEERPGPERA